ncbi:MAG: divergent polysaccharide deacetylase family protein [Acetobacteraceae bacterium]|nr:divergent polysaccharide deacetylase family protein [Acetobacteraceae bacterium]
MAATSQRRPPGWHALGAFWAIVVAVAGCGCLVLQLLGPPLPRVVPVAAPVPVAQAPKPAPVAAPTPPGQIAAPQPALLEQSSLYPPAMLPRIGPNGQVSRIVYARPFKAEQRPTIAIVITGLGMSEAESRAAIETLPGPVSLAFSPYAPNPDSLLDLSRKAGHEMLISLPLEPQGYPLNDAGSKSLLTGASPSQNAANLEWSLSRIQGYVGAIGALDAMRGERFAEQSSTMRTVLDDLSQRGLLYVDPRPGKSIDNLAQVPGRSIDVVIDDPQSRADIEGKLAALERLARERGSALGFAGPLRPVTVERIATWARGLADKGMVLAPVSALINPLVQPEGVAR